MNCKVLIFLYLVLFPSGILLCQNGTDQTRTLEKLFAKLVNNYDDESRLKINDSILAIIDKYVESDSVFNHRFANIRYLGQIKPQNSSLKIITWNLILKNVPSRYYSYLIRKGEGQKNIVYKLTSEYSKKPVLTDTTYMATNWYGALYYDFRLYRNEDDMHWIILGIDFGNPEITRKIVDVLSFNADGTPVFGKRRFNTGKEIRYRDVFEYASNGMMTLRFRNDSSIVFDHLVPFSPAQEGNRQFYGPDYSYDAYQLKKTGLWQLEINVDVRNEN